MDKLLSDVDLYTYRSKSSTMCSEVIGRLSGRKLMMELKTFVVVAEPAPVAASRGDPRRAADDNGAPPAPSPVMPLWMCLPTLFIAQCSAEKWERKLLVSRRYNLSYDSLR